MYSDSHIHSSFSADSDADMEQLIQRAISLDMKYISITDHQDFDYPDLNLKFDLNIEEYYQTIQSLQIKYADKINILLGVETGIEPHLHNKITDFVKQVPFDFIIGSSHLVYRKDPYSPEFFQNRSDLECFEEYFHSILVNLKVHSEFDIYGHLDYIVRYSPNKNVNYSYSVYSDIIDEILKTLIRMNKGIEINTAGFKYGLQTTNPCPEIIKRYKELGGELITIGSDAHTPEYIGHEFDKAAGILSSCGFSYYNVFRNRQPIFLKL